MHIWPTKHSDVWRQNIACLLRRMEQFNGQRVVSIVTDASTVPVDVVKKAFQGTVTNFMHFQNDPVLGEAVSFRELFKRVENIDPRAITGYFHGKGTKY